MGGVCTTSSKKTEEVFIPCTNNRFYPRIIDAAARGNFEEVAKCLACGAKVNSCDGTGRSALHLACAEGHEHVAHLLIMHGAELDSQDRCGHEPMHECLLNGHDNIKNLLINAGSKLSTEILTELEGKFRHAAASNDVTTVKNLAKSGINVNATDYYGRSALHVAAERGNFEIVECLVECGADVNLKDTSGQSVSAMASQNHRFRVMNLLAQAGAESAATPSRKPRKASFAIMEACARPIAVATLEGRRIEPITRACASLFISDVVGFTTICASLEPRKVAQMLNSLYERFDRLAYVHGVQKIDVIGDAYIAASNLTEDQPDDHAARIARFAAAAVAAAAETPIDPDAPHKSVQIRVGLHSGAVAAAVVGQRHLKYTLMGEAVSVAGKMEREGLPGRVHCSAACAALIAAQSHEFVLQPRSHPRTTIAEGTEPTSRPSPASFWVTRLRNGWRHFRSCPALYTARASHDRLDPGVNTQVAAADILRTSSEGSVMPWGSQLLSRSTSAPRLSLHGSLSPRAEIFAADAVAGPPAAARRASRQQRRCKSICDGPAAGASGMGHVTTGGRDDGASGLNLGGPTTEARDASAAAMCGTSHVTAAGRDGPAARVSGTGHVGAAGPPGEGSTRTCGRLPAAIVPLPTRPVPAEAHGPMVSEEKCAACGRGACQPGETAGGPDAKKHLLTI